MMAKIGEGGFAPVFKIKHKNGGFLACKTYVLKGKTEKTNMQNEISCMELMNGSPYIVKLIRHFVIAQSKQSSVFIVMELAEGAFDTYITQKGPLNEQDAKFFFGQMSRAIEVIHSAKVAHCDIKPANFLLTSRSSRMHLLLCDFGMGRVGNGNAPILGTICWGTPAYMAPEILTTTVKKYDCQGIDIWALGISLYEMVTKETPFDVTKDDRGADQMANCEWQWPNKVTNPLEELVEGMLDPDIQGRFNIKRVIEHKWAASGYASAKKFEKN